MIRTVVGSPATTSAVRAMPRSAPTSPTNEPGIVTSGSRPPSISTRSEPSTSTATVGVIGVVLVEQPLTFLQPALGQAVGEHECLRSSVHRRSVRRQAAHRPSASVSMNGQV